MRDSAGGADEEGEGDAEEGEGASCDAAEEVQRVGEESGVVCLLEELSVWRGGYYWKWFGGVRIDANMVLK